MIETNDKIRNLNNSVRLAGYLAELDKITEGVTSAGIPYLSFRGAIQCSEDPAATYRFRVFVKSKKANGEDSKTYVNMKNWVYSAVPKTKNSENPTMVELRGSLSDSPYVAKTGELREATEFNMQLVNRFTEFAAEVDIEGFVHSIVDEYKSADNDEPTGRQRMRLIGRDVFGNTLDLKNLIIASENVQIMKNAGYDKGCTATFYIELIPHTINTAPKAEVGGFGKRHVSNTAVTRTEWVVTGADPVIDSDSVQALHPKQIKDAMAVRQEKLDEIKTKGYLGNGGSAPVTTNRGSFGGTQSGAIPAYADIEAIESFPF